MEWVTLHLYELALIFNNEHVYNQLDLYPVHDWTVEHIFVSNLCPEIRDNEELTVYQKYDAYLKWKYGA
jgi:hypothetical protein